MAALVVRVFNAAAVVDVVGAAAGAAVSPSSSSPHGWPAATAAAEASNISITAMGVGMSIGGAGRMMAPALKGSEGYSIV